MTVGEVGAAVRRREDRRLLLGGGRYVSDLRRPGMLHLALARSPHAHADIRAVDVSQASAAPGVVAVFTGRDWDEAGFGGLPVRRSINYPGGSPMTRPPRPALAGTRVRHVGECVGLAAS